MNAYNVVIIGSGPAGLFAAMQLEQLGLERIAIIDRHPYPAGGLLNDGKLNFDYRVGIDLDELKIDRESAQCLMEEIRRVFIHFPKCRQVPLQTRIKPLRPLETLPKSIMHNL
jgi:2-polyprenyl-6-methoxyphenol hydroxylase-like FAD-dependent oxidoreductase